MNSSPTPVAGEPVPPVSPATLPARAATGSMAVTLTQDASGVAVVGVAGEIDLSTSDEFGATLRRAVDASPCHVAVVDLDLVEFLAACGLAVLIETHRHAGRLGGRLQLVVHAAAPAVRSLRFLPPDGPDVKVTPAGPRVVHEPRRAPADGAELVPERSRP